MGYFLRTTDRHGKAYGDFQWLMAVGAIVKAPDWSPKPECGGGLHGLLDGAGASSHLNWSDDALWWVVEADNAGIIDLGGKYKFPKCKILVVGDRKLSLIHI